MKMNMEEMEVVREFLENRTKVCRAQEGCDDCPFWGVCSHDVSTVMNDGNYAKWWISEMGGGNEVHSVPELEYILSDIEDRSLSVRAAISITESHSGHTKDDKDHLDDLLEARSEVEAAIEKMKSDGEPVVLHCLIY